MIVAGKTKTYPTPLHNPRHHSPHVSPRVNRYSSATSIVAITRTMGSASGGSVEKASVTRMKQRILTADRRATHNARRGYGTSVNKSSAIGPGHQRRRGCLSLMLAEVLVGPKGAGAAWAFPSSNSFKFRTSSCCGATMPASMASIPSSARNASLTEKGCWCMHSLRTCSR